MGWRGEAALRLCRWHPPMGSAFALWIATSLASFPPDGPTAARAAIPETPAGSLSRHQPAEPPPAIRRPGPAAEDAAISTSVQADSVLLLDFETGSIEDWVPRPTDRPHFKALEFRSDQALSGRRSLYCEIEGYEEGIPKDNEECRIRYLLPRPVRIDSTTVISWTWWFRDRERNDGIHIGIWATDGRTPQRLYTTWMSHSLYQRGPWPFDDPAGRPVSHRCTIGARLRMGEYLDWPPPPWYVVQIDLSVVFPTDQILFLDDLRIGPARGAPEPHPSRTQNLAVMPELTFLKVADIDGDGRIDQIIGQADAPPIVRLARSDGEYRSLDPSEAGLDEARSLRDAAFADLDEDGRLDLVGLDRRGLLFFRGLGRGEFRQMPPVRPVDLMPLEEVARPGPDQAIPKLPAGVLAADLLPNPGTEILLSRTVALQMDSIYVWLGDWRWKSEPLPPPCIGPPPPPLPIAGRYRHGAAVGDVDGDQRLDLLLANTDLMMQTPRGLICESMERLPGCGTLEREPAFGDIDNDGDLDLFLPVDLRNRAGSADAAQAHSLLWVNDRGRYTDISEKLQAFDIRHAHAPILEDLDLDGDLDLWFLQSAWSRKMPLRPPNIYLQNNSKGEFSEQAGQNSWLSEIPPAVSAVSCDADDDGDPDLLIVPRETGVPLLCTNLSDKGRSIKVRLLDRRGAPHAAGASIALYQTPAGGGRGPLVGHRQSGVGSVLPGCGEAIFGCPSAGPFELVVTWPREPGRPMVRRDLRPGSRVTLIEPAFAGAPGGLVSRIDVGRRQWADRLGGSGWQLLVPLATLYGVCAGVAGFAFRRVLPQKRGLALREAGWRSPRLRRLAFLLLAAAGAAGLMIGRPVWPQHRAARLGAALAEGGLAFGAAVGLAAAWLDSKRRQALRAQVVGAEEARAALLAAIDGFSHAQWLRYLGGIAALTRSLAEGVDPEAVFSRLRARIDSYGATIHPQLREIIRILPKAGLDPDVARTFSEDCMAIEEGVRAVRSMLDQTGAPGRAAGALLGQPGDSSSSGIIGPTSSTALERLAEAAGRMHETVQSIFRDLGRGLRADIAPAVSAAIDRAREELGGLRVHTELPATLPRVFATPGDLANILENLLVNAGRAARANMAARPAEVSVSARRLGGLVMISVRDSGAGVPAERQPILFDARITDPDRHGRGLPYARRRLHQLDGDVRLAASSPQEGTEFVVTLRVLAD